MREVAQENIGYVNKYFNKEEQNVMVKVGYSTDDGKDNEHLWFILLNINEDGTMEAELDSEPYYITSMKKGDKYTFSVNQITDWMIVVDGVSYIPDEVYRLD